MSERRYLLVLSGQVCREHSRDLRNFWSGFIAIQRGLNPAGGRLEIVAHSWNPEHDELVRQVYAPRNYRSERQPNFLPEYAGAVNPPDAFEAGLVRVRSTWKRVSPQALLGNAQSRSAAAALISDDESDDTQVIFARWDQGQTGSRSVNQMVHDPALPRDLIYMADYAEIDEGYADMWIVAPLPLARRFAGYKAFVLDSLAGRNDYVADFTRKGWPMTLRGAPGTLAQVPVLGRLLQRYAGRRRLGRLEQVYTYARQRLKRWRSRLLGRFDPPREYGEHSMMFGEQLPTAIWPQYQALNNHALLKYFIHSQGLRGLTRFLAAGDFAGGGSGHLINPLPYALVVYSHSSYSDCWPMVLGQARRCMPANCAHIVLLSEESEQTRVAHAQLQAGEVELLAYDDRDPYTERLRKAFEHLSARWPVVYFIHEDMPLYAPVDAPYLNALLHYFTASNELYIKLVDTTAVDDKQPHPEFPGLVVNTGGHALSVQPSLIKPANFAALLRNYRCGIYEFEGVSAGANLQFASVGGDRLVGKYMLGNNQFPHIATAIAKGKWCVSEWSAEIGQLAAEYKLDLQLRGVN